MIKRNYFIKAEIHKDKRVTHSWRQYWVKSWFADPQDAINYQVKNIANDNNVSVLEVIVTSFSRV